MGYFQEFLKSTGSVTRLAPSKAHWPEKRGAFTTVPARISEAGRFGNQNRYVFSLDEVQGAVLNAQPCQMAGRALRGLM